MANLAPVPSENNTCTHCAAPLVADQRYCLSCGQPSSPVRLAFLDVLESERQPQSGPGAVSSVPVAYTPYVEPTAGPAWLRRYAPLFGVLSVLLMALIVGLLVGHWVTQGKSSSSGPQVIKIEGLPAVAAAPTTTASGVATTPSSTPASKGKSATSAKSEEAKEEAEAKAEEKEEEKHPAKAPAAKALNSTEATKLESTTGKKKEAELNKLTTAPVEVK
jgi:hypothetical protein